MIEAVINCDNDDNEHCKLEMIVSLLMMIKPINTLKTLCQTCNFYNNLNDNHQINYDSDEIMIMNKSLPTILLF